MKKKWLVITILAIAQFVMVLDSTVMNVSLTTVAKDLGTTISGMQTAITFYTLTMAAFMLTGGKLGDRWGRLGAFRIGAVIYGLGSLMTGFAPNLGVLLLGWSLIEGLGAVLVIPAIAALTSVNYKGKDRVIAFAVIGGISGVAAALGPLIGGFMTTYLSWRYVFIGETVIMLGVLLVAGKINDARIKNKPKIDGLSVLLSASGMGVLVFGILQSKVWGWIRPLSAPTINGKAITPLGISLVAYMILAGAMILRAFYHRQQKLEANGGTPLLKVSLLANKQLRSGLSVLTSQYLILAALFFVLPVYLQVVLGYDALQTGIKILPLSIAVVLFSVVGTRLVAKLPLRKVIRGGQLGLVLGSVILLIAINEELRGFLFGSGMFVVGAGLGLLASQLGNINMTAVGRENSAEGGGLQGTFQNLGSSLGTALIGSVFIASLTTGFVKAINDTSLPSNVKSSITTGTAKGVPIVSTDQVESYAESKGLPASEASEISQTYSQSQIEALKFALFAVAAIALLSMYLSKNIPNQIETAKA